MNRTMVLAVLLALLPAARAKAQTTAPDSTSAPVVLTLDDAIRTALSENISVRVADMEIEKTGYARKGTYSALFPQVDGTGTYQRTIKKQVMYMDFAGEAGADGFEVGRWNTMSAGLSASMPVVNAQLWQSLHISDSDVELAVEKARSSRLETVTEVKQTFFSCLLAKEVFEVYKSVYENAVANLEFTQKKYNAQRASELDLTRAKTNLASAIPNVYDSENSVMLCLWQLKAVMGVDLDMNIDVAGSMEDYSGRMFYDIHSNDEVNLDRNSSLRQLAIQAEELATAVKMQQAANLPSLSASINYSVNAMTNDFNFKEYKWSPYSYVGLSLHIPIFAGGKRSNAIKQAKVQAAELDLRRVDTERQLRVSIRQCLNTMENAMKSYTSAQSAVESAHKAYDIAQKSYNVGRSTFTDLDNAQLALTQAQLTVCQAVFSFLSAKSTLEQTLGTDYAETPAE